MERLSNRRKPAGINGDALRNWGLVFLIFGVIGRGVLQTHYLGMEGANGQQLLEIMSASDLNMNLITTSLLFQAVETCAVPIFALLLVNGVMHTRDLKAYFLRVAGTALAAEIPFNLAMNGKLLAFSSRNPAFGVLLSMIMLYFYGRYAGRGIQNVLVRILVTAAAVVWCQMLKIDSGVPMVLMVCVLWAFRTKPLYRNFAGATAAIVCSVISPFFAAAPMGFLAVHLYNGEACTRSRTFHYSAYPAILLAAGLAGLVI